MPRVVSNRASPRHNVILLTDVVRQTLYAFADRPLVNGICADRIHPSATSGGSEGNRRPECVVELAPFATRNVLDDGRHIVCILRLRQPNAYILSGAGREL